MSARLNILWVSHMAPSPPRSGAQARVHGLMTSVAKRHDITAVILVEPEFDIEECRAAMRESCKEVVLIPNPHNADLKTAGEGAVPLFHRHLEHAQNVDADLK